MNDMVPVRHSGADVEAYRASTEAANICKEIVLKTSSRIQGKQYVSVEGWQAIAVAHGCAAGACDVERVDGGVRAVGEVRRMSDGQLIARAEGFVGEDEPTWFGGDSRGKKLPKRADYAIRAMAQTRAISRACRSAFAHVVVMMNAGLATTPAEEMVTFDVDTGEVIETGERERTPPLPGITKIKNNLNKMMRDGNKATDLEAFRALVKANKDDIKAIREAGHSYWTGDGEDFDGFEKWMERRYAELGTAPSEDFQMCMETLEACTTTKELEAWFKLNSKYVETLDGEESRRIQVRYDELEAGFKAAALVSAG